MLLRSIPLALLLTFAGAPAWADGLADLKAALPKLISNQPVKARLAVQLQSRQGEGKEATLEQGTAGMTVEDDAQGLRLAYAPELLDKLRAEGQARERDAKAVTPTSKALGAMSLREVRAMTAAAESLTSLLGRSTFKQESATTLRGQPARLLSFDLGPGLMSERDRKYVKESQGSLQVWISADGTPLEAHWQMSLKGRAMLVISFETQTSEKIVYARWGDRLVAQSREQLQGGSGGGEKGETSTSYTLQR